MKIVQLGAALAALGSAAAFAVPSAAEPLMTATLPALGSPQAAKLRPIDSGATIPGGPDVRTLDLRHWKTVHPPHSPYNDPKAREEVSKGKKQLPSWSASVTYDKTYNFTMLGETVLGKKATTTKITTVIVPLIFKFNNVTFDATKPFTNCSPAGAATMVAQSPLYQKVSYSPGGANVGKSQFIDLFQRENFWGYVQKNNPKYHLLYVGKQTSPITITVSDNGQGEACNTGANGALGTVDFNTFDNLVRKTLIPQLKQYVDPSVIPLFLAYDVVFGGAAGYHDAFTVKSGVQVYGVSTYLDVLQTAPDTEVLSHEMAEFTDDPYVNNPTPAWGHVGQVQNGCQNNLEPGDPLSGENWAVVKMSNGYSYTVTDLANFSWFYRESPSFAVNGYYTMFNFFSSYQQICTQ
jgi:hypothetical protein